MDIKTTKECIRCNNDFKYSEDQCRWNYQGVTPTKIIECPHCSCIQAVKFEPEKNLNYDERYY